MRPLVDAIKCYQSNFQQAVRQIHHNSRLSWFTRYKHDISPQPWRSTADALHKTTAPVAGLGSYTAEFSLVSLSTSYQLSSIYLTETTSLMIACSLHAQN